MNSKNRLERMLERIDDIEYFISLKKGKVVAALNDRVLRPAIRMQLVSLAEDFNKLA